MTPPPDTLVSSPFAFKPLTATILIAGLIDVRAWMVAASSMSGTIKGRLVAKMGLGEKAQIAQEIMKRTGRETRTVVLGHLQRDGAPTTQDRILGTRFGVGAVQLIQEKKFGHMVSYLNYQIGAVTIKEALGRIKHVPPESQVVKTAQAVGISFGI